MFAKCRTCRQANRLFTGFRSPSPVRLCPSCLRRFGDLRKMTPPDFLSMYVINLVIFCQFEAPLVKFSKSGQSDQMTMPARRASKFSAQWRAIKLQTVFQSLNSQAIPGFCEPWSECQPEESRPPEGRPEDSSIYIYIYSPNSLCCRGSGGVSSVLGIGVSSISAPAFAKSCAQAR